MIIKKLFENNKKWVENRLLLDKDYFKNLTQDQNPDILYICCSDSRITVMEMMGLMPGDAFVYRNVANLAPNNDLSVQSAINYAVQYLKVDHIVICGHYYCGGVKAALGPKNLGVINPWLQNIKDVIQIHEKELYDIVDEDKRYKRLIELNVQEQCINVLKNPSVQNALKERPLQIHGWVFDIKTGYLIDLEIDFSNN